MTVSNPMATEPTPSATAALSGAERDAASKQGVRFMAGIVFGFLGLSVLVHGVALTYVFTANTDIVRTDYYQAGERYDEELALRTKGSALPFKVALEPGDAGRVTLSLPDAPATLRGATGRVMLYRPGDARLDRVLPLQPATASDTAAWQSPASAIPVGRWRVRVEFDAPHALAFEQDHNLR